MFNAKARTEVIAFLSVALVFCSFFETPVQKGFSPLLEIISETKSTESPNLFATYSQKHNERNFFSNHEVIRLGMFTDDEHTYPANYVRKFAIIGQVLLIGGFELRMFCAYSGIVMPRCKRISVLALSLGGNSPPYYSSASQSVSLLLNNITMIKNTT